MSKKTLFIGAVASIIAINSVFADTTVTSKQYVDTTRQSTIPVAGTNASTPGSTVTYTGTAGQIGERGIFNPATDFNFQNNTIADGHEGDLVTADIYPAVGNIYNQIRDIQHNMPDFDDLPETTVTYKTCYQEVDGECILWNLTDKDVYGNFCTKTSDCPSCEGGLARYCDANRCQCVNNTLG